MVEDSRDTFIRIPIANIIQHCNPMKSDIWGIGRSIEPSEIEFAIASCEFEDKHKDHNLRDRKYHIQRIAYFVVVGDENPIDLDVGIGGVPPSWWMVSDGNHRLFAAQLRGDRDISCVVQGNLDYAVELFFVDIPVL